MAIRRLLMAALVMGSFLAIPAGVAAAPIPIAVNVITGQTCIDGTGPRNAEVIATLRTSGGHFRGRFRTFSEDDGFWFGCFPGAVNGNDRLKVIVGNRDRTIRIPRMEPRIDRVANTITGRAPADSVVFANINHLRTFKQQSEHSLATQADSNGNYTFDTTGEVNLRGNDLVFVVAPHGDDTFGAVVFVPHVNVTHGDNSINGTANNGTDLRFTLTGDNGNVKAEVTAGTSPLLFGISLFLVNMFNDGGVAQYPVDGNRLTSTLAPDAVLRMPTSQLDGDSSTEMVRGRCMAHAPYQLVAGGEFFFGTSDSNGRLVRDVGNRMNLRRGDSLTLTCLYPTGDTWSRTGIAL